MKLEDITGIGTELAGSLREMGIETVEDFVRAKESDLLSIEGVGEVRLQRFRESAIDLLGGFPGLDPELAAGIMLLDHEIDFRFDTEQAELWLRDSTQRKVNAYKWVLLADLDVEERHIPTLISYLLRAIAPGGLLFVPKDLSLGGNLPKLEVDEDESTERYFALIVE